VQADRTPPHDLSLERSVLGSMMLDNSIIPEVMDAIKEPAVFHSSRHQKVFNGITVIHASGDPVDLVSVREYLKKKNQLETIGGTIYLTELTEAVVSTSNAPQHSMILHEKYLLRLTITRCNEILTDCYDPKEDVAHIIERAEMLVLLGQR